MTVYVVGAGPGDPGLLTRRGGDLLATAEHVVYDRASMEPLLELAPGAHRHRVGLARGTPALLPDEVIALLTRLGRESDRVVRLKAGDPCTVSRGGEEAMALAAAGVPVQIVPGVSAAVAAPAAAGIPVMVRRLARTLTVVAGNDDPEYPGDVDWDAVAGVGGTVVVLTGRATLRRTLDALRTAGLPGGTPIAVISAATRPTQQVRRGTLDDPPDARLPAPLTVVIGAVAAVDVGGWHAHP